MSSQYLYTIRFFVSEICFSPFCSGCFLLCCGLGAGKVEVQGLVLFEVSSIRVFFGSTATCLLLLVLLLLLLQHKNDILQGCFGSAAQLFASFCQHSTVLSFIRVPLPAALVEALVETSSTTGS